MYVEAFKTAIIVFIGNVTLTDNIQDQRQSVVTENIPQRDQTKKVVVQPLFSLLHFLTNPMDDAHKGN
jgi:hypothetical protein